MLKAKYRQFALVAAIVVAVLPGLASQAATSTFPGSITITSPTANSAAHGTVPIEWTWRSGTYVKSTSKVDIAISTNGVSWSNIARYVPIRDGGTDWVTGQASAIYAIRATVNGTRVKTYMSPLVIDNGVPEVEITRPTPTEVVVDDQTLASQRYVIGVATVEARAFDDFTGIDTIEWALDGDPIDGGTGASFTFDFGANPGQHQLTAIATDYAGNSASHTIDLLVLPGASAIGQVPPVPVDPNSPPPLPVDPNSPPAVPVDPNSPPAVPVDPNSPPAVPVDPNSPPPLPEGLPSDVPNPVPTT